MSNTILIARPHTFIVAVMKPFLEECGYGTHRLEHLGDLRTRSSHAAGAVISLALSSFIAESADEVFVQLRRAAPRVPVLFASMLTLEQAQPALKRIAKQAGLQASTVGLNTAPATANQLGRQETFLYFSKDDLTSPERRAIATRLVQRHFRSVGH